MVEPRLCDFEPAIDQDILVKDISTLQDAQPSVTLCPKCQQRSGMAALHLRQDRYGSARYPQARIYTVPVLYRVDDIRDCPKCRVDPDDHGYPTERRPEKPSAL